MIFNNFCAIQSVEINLWRIEWLTIKMKQNLGFADFALASSIKLNRSLKNMEKLDKAIDWSWVDAILMNHYAFGTNGEGADAYPPLLLFFKLAI